MTPITELKAFVFKVKDKEKLNKFNANVEVTTRFNSLQRMLGMQKPLKESF